MTPPRGIIKLSFDESFILSIRRAGIGVVVRDWPGKVVRSFSGPLDSLDANEVDVFALLVVAMDRVDWDVLMLSFRVILFLLFGGVPVILLIPGGWLIGFKRCRIFHVNWVPVLIIFYEMLMSWRMLFLGKESFVYLFLLMYSFLLS